MKRTNKLNAFFILLVAVAIGLGCSEADQTAEANRIVLSANKRLEEIKEFYGKTEKRNKELFSAKIRNLYELDQYKKQKNVEAKAIVNDYEKAAGMLKELSKQYDEVSRLNVNETYKNYARLKTDEYAKRAEVSDARKGNPQAFLEIDNPDTLLAKFDEINSKTDRLEKDAEDLELKAKKIEEENKEMFKQT